MQTQIEIGFSSRKKIDQLGFISALAAFVSTMFYVVVQLWQVYGKISYPYDEILIYSSSFCIVIPFLLSILAFHYFTEEDKKIWSHGALLFAILYAVFVTANYTVQLATVIPMTLAGKAN